ncbi:MAG: hypothetical protein HC897_03815 [Thermoanaerobaculia bacterium]|nr:hypothetical protein [Thermoanaerobaculia bacterium]
MTSPRALRVATTSSSGGAEGDVEVDGGAVAAQRFELARAHFLTAFECVGETETKCEVGGRVLIEQRMLEAALAAGDGGVGVDERNLTQVAGAVVDLEPVGEDVGAARGPEIDDAAAAQLELESFDDRTSRQS